MDIGLKELVLPYSFKKSIQIHFLIFLVTAIATVLYMKNQVTEYTYYGTIVHVSYTPSMIIDAVFTTSFYIATCLFLVVTTIRNLYYYFSNTSPFSPVNLLKDYLWGAGTLLLNFIIKTVLGSLFSIELL